MTKEVNVKILSFSPPVFASGTSSPKSRDVFFEVENSLRLYAFHYIHKSLYIILFFGGFLDENLGTRTKENVGT